MSAPTVLTLTIRLGGESAPQTGDEIAERLRVVANKISANYGADYLDEWTGLGGGIHSAKGDPLGRWGIERDEQRQENAS